MLGVQVSQDRLNSIRAAVLGASDGIVSVGAILFGVAAARPGALLLTAVAAVIAGACSMALGEYVSVHAQLDASEAGLGGLRVSPVRAALSSGTSFVAGAILPVVTVCLTPVSVRIPIATVSVLASLALCGYVTAASSGVSPRRSVLRVTMGGALALAITYGAGLLMSVGSFWG